MPSDPRPAAPEPDDRMWLCDYCGIYPRTWDAAKHRTERPGHDPVLRPREFLQMPPAAAPDVPAEEPSVEIIERLRSVALYNDHYKAAAIYDAIRLIESLVLAQLPAEEPET